MMQMTIFGIGAAGNKAAITLIENEIVDRAHVKLMNTSVKDIPEEYKNDPELFIPFSSGLGGCGKEPSKGRAAIIKAINNHQVNLGELLNEDSKEVVLVSSVEGGTGSGAVPAVAQWFDKMNIPVHVFALIGFQDEARGINNTLKFFKDLPSNVILHTICNSYFLDYTKNYGKAEKAANEEFAREIEILRGSKLIPSKQIIDDTDLYKVNIQPGYSTIYHIPLNNIKNTENFNAAIAKAFENSCHMDNDNSAKRIAVVINASSKVQDAVDNSFEVVKRYVGVPIETFQHIQPDDDLDLDGEEYIDIIACGMNYPERPIRDINNKYLKVKEKLSTSRKSFDDIFGNIEMDDDLDEFNVDIKQMVDPSKADDLFAEEAFATVKPKAKVTNKVDETPKKPKEDEPKTTAYTEVVEELKSSSLDNY